MTTADLKDLTSFEKLARYLDTDPEIIGGIQVLTDIPLYQVADACLNGEVEKLKAWVNSKDLLIVASKDYSVSPLFDIPHTNCVDVIRVEPYLIFKDLKKPYI